MPSLRQLIFAAMTPYLKLPTPQHPVFTRQGVTLWLKRDDTIHPQVSGNKWRKLKYWWEEFRLSGKSEILTFGGAFSNHLAAVADFGQHQGIPTHALVRGEEKPQNQTLDFCRSCGMNIDYISRSRYRQKDDPEFMEMLSTTLPQVFIIPEGGKGLPGLKGCAEILDEVSEPFDYVACAAGTGTTAAGLLSHKNKATLLVYPALKGASFLQRAIAQQWAAINPGKTIAKKWEVIHEYHCGGYGKVTPDLIAFINYFYRLYKIPLDPVYTGKMMYGLWQDIYGGKFAPGTRILAIHTGGLQGIAGMNSQLKKNSKPLIEYEN